MKKRINIFILFLAFLIIGVMTLIIDTSGNWFTRLISGTQQKHRFPIFGSADENCFPDISEQPREYRQAICLAKEFSIISGYRGRFNPDQEINRAEVSKILMTGPATILGIIQKEEIPRLIHAFPTPDFTDISKDDWFYGYVEAAAEIGIFDGYPNGQFKPSNALINAEASKVIVNMLLRFKPELFTAQDSILSNTFTGDEWFAPYIRVMNLNGGDLPLPSDTEKITQPISRAQFIYNLLILLDSKSKKLIELIH